MLIDSIIYPIPDEKFIEDLEKYWRVSLPSDYKLFLIENNGAIPLKKVLEIKKGSYILERFLCVLKETKSNPLGIYDIDVVMSQLDERIFFHEDTLGYELIPIASLFGGDFVCLDYSKRKENPEICVWSHENSYELEPNINFVADNFTEFLEMLHE